MAQRAFLSYLANDDRQIWQVGTSRGINSNEINEDAADTITSRLRDKLKKYILYHNAYDQLGRIVT